MAPETEFFRQLPKAELHQHLDGSLSPEFLLRRSEAEGFELPFETPEGCLEWVRSRRAGSLERYLELFEVTLRALQTTEALTEAVQDCARSWAAEGIRYAELRFAPNLHQRSGLSLEAVMEAVLDGLKWARQELKIESGLILCALRHRAEWEHLPRLWRGFANSGIPLAVDLAGPERGHPPGLFSPLFQTAVREGIPITIHAGEAEGPSSMVAALDQGARRLGHGVRLIEEWASPQQPLTRRLREQKIALELCPSSNLQTGAWKDIANYPLRDYLQQGLLVTINTDNTLISTTTLSREWESIWGGKNYEVTGVVRTLLHSFLCAFHPEVSQPQWIRQHIVAELEALLGSEARTAADSCLDDFSQNGS